MPSTASTSRSGTTAPEPAAILSRIGKWYGAVKESLVGTEPYSHLTSNRNLLLTRQANTLYVHLHKDPLAAAVKLRPITAKPRRATLLNTGRPVQFSVTMLPSDHLEQKAYLCLHNLPAGEMANTVMVVKLEFDGPIPAA